ncbi:MAG: serpin family protein [Acidimicrobiales bacterium]
MAVGAIAALVAAACGADGNPASTVAASAGVERSAVDPDAPVAELTAGLNDAGFDLLQTQPVTDNLVFSPLSIGHALLMAREAADPATAGAIDVTFGLPAGIAAHDAWNALDVAIAESNATAEALDGSESPIVTLASRLWPSTTASPDQGWVDLMASHHGADVELIDVADGEGSRQRVNQWVSDQTNELIPELLPPGFIGPGTVLVLTDAVYFKAQWQTVFGKYGPEDGVFTRLDGTEVDTSYLVDLEQPGPRGVGDGYVGAELPYLGDDYTMLLIVPDEGRFDEVRGRLSTDLLAEIDAAFTPGPYELRMPEWETTTAIDLLGWLGDEGIAPGSFPGISPDAFLAGAVHGADITVDENGTEAAAATALGFEEEGPPEPELVVAADRPFLYLVRHVDSGAVLFAGQVTDPTA